MTVENYCRVYSELYGLDTVSLRYFNVYGTRQKGTGAYANVISSWCTKLAKDEPIIVYGDGTQIRYYVHVSSVVKANIAAAFDYTSLSGSVFNVGTGSCWSVNDLVGLFRASNGHSLNVKFEPGRVGDVLQTCASTTKLERFFPALKDQKNGLGTFLNPTLKWYKENTKL